MPKKQIYLTGFMGTGKSMILNCLHEVCGFDKIEMDERLHGYHPWFSSFLP